MEAQSRARLAIAKRVEELGIQDFLRTTKSLLMNEDLKVMSNGLPDWWHVNENVLLSATEAPVRIATHQGEPVPQRSVIIIERTSPHLR